MPAATLIRADARAVEQPAYYCDPDFIRGLMGGLRARKEGRMRPWSEVKAELGIR